MPNKLTDEELQKLIYLVRETQWHYQLDQFSDASLKEINKSVAQARLEISAKLLADSESMRTWEKDRFDALAIEMQDMTVAIQSQISGQIEDTTIAAGLKAYPQHADIMSFGGLVPNFNNVAMTAVQLKAMVNTPVGGKLLSEWVETAFTANLKDTFKQEITTGLLKGESYKNLVDRFKTKAFAGLESDIEGLTRTYVQSINVQAMNDTMKANSDIIKGWKVNSVMENRTCIRCMALDSAGIIYPIGKGPELPLHPRCRCFPEIVTKSFRELGVDIDDVKDNYRTFSIRGTVDPVTGKVTPGKIGVGGGRIIDSGRFLGTYEDFFKQLPENVQLQILGPTRLGLYKSGKLSLAGLADKNGNVVLLKDLGKTAVVVKPPPEIIRTKSIAEAHKAMAGFEVSAAQKAALKDYTGGGFNTINGHLRGMKELSPETLTVVEKNMSVLDDFLKTAPRVEAETYRGVTLNKKLFDGWKQMKKGEPFIDPGFVSTSYDRKIVKDFVGNAQYSAEMVIKGKNGVLVESLSDKKSEKEVLLLRNTKFIVESIKVKEKGVIGSILFNLKEI